MSEPDKDRDALKELIKSIPGKTLAAKLRTVMPEIDARVRSGVQHQEIIETLNEQGFDINLNTFRSYLYRYRKKVNQGKAEKVDCTNHNESGLHKPESEPPSEANNTDGNLSVEDGGNGGNQKAETTEFNDLLDGQKRDAFSEKYMNMRKPISHKRSK
ncbi:hypothetical protein QUO15_004419 [Vibrio parahaemolyticus]|nr:hypothetical protein [Vibrio parahaemolyticus]